MSWFNKEIWMIEKLVPLELLNFSTSKIQNENKSVRDSDHFHDSDHLRNDSWIHDSIFVC